jgi:hypothetical protein
MAADTLVVLSDFAALDIEQPAIHSDAVCLRLVFENKIPVVVAGRVAKLIAAVRFKRPLACYFGLPNDEALSGHPLYNRGLQPCRAYEVGGSSWIAELSKRNSVHPSHTSDSFADMHHYLFTFKDELFECVAAGYELDSESANAKTA